MQRDLGAMTTEEQRAAVMRDAPELAALLADLQSNLAEVRSRVGPLLTEVGFPEHSTPHRRWPAQWMQCMLRQFSSLSK